MINHSMPRVGRLSKIALALLLLPLLNACGDSDSDPVVANPTPDVGTTTPPGSGAQIPDFSGGLSPELKKHFNLLVNPTREEDGIINVYLGRWFPCSSAHLEMCDQAAMKVDGVTEPSAKYNVRAYKNQSQYHMAVKLSDLRAWKNQALRDDIFKPGNYTVLDLMLYVSDQREDFKVTLGEFNEARQTYDYTVSFDADGDGKFTAPAGGEKDYQYTEWMDYKDSDLWGAALSHSGGTMLNNFNGYLETIYDRLDETLVRGNTDVRLQPVSHAYRDRVHATHLADVAFYKANGNKTMLKEITLDMSDTDGYGTDGLEQDTGIVRIAENINVKAYNLRPDIYQPGVITALDMVISANDKELNPHLTDVNFGFTFWPTLYTGSDLGSYVMNEITHDAVGTPTGTLRAEGLDGWNYAAGMEEFTLDIMTTGSQNNLTAQSFVDGQHIRECDWLREEKNGPITLEKAQECIDHWSGTFGGNKLHVAMDNMVRNFGMDYIYFSWVDKMYRAYNTTEVNSVNSGRLDKIINVTKTELDPDGKTHYVFPALVDEPEAAHNIKDVTLAIEPLTPEHTGWNVADCAMCHKADDMVKVHNNETARSVGYNDAQHPYECAACHGANGAPQGHGETARCFWCHSENKDMKNHGDASLWHSMLEVECGDNVQHMGNNITIDHTLPGTCADKMVKTDGSSAAKTNWKGENYSEAFSEGHLRTRSNSDYHTSESFPDPYSCVTCHQNPKTNQLN